MNPSYILLRAILFMTWPPSVLASGAFTLDKTLGDIPSAVWLIVFILSTLGGLTSLLHTLKVETPKNMFLFVSSHMLMAWFAGACSFFLMERLEVDDLLEIPLLAFSAYLGARFVDMVAERLMKTVESKLGKPPSGG